MEISGPFSRTQPIPIRSPSTIKDCAANGIPVVNRRAFLIDSPILLIFWVASFLAVRYLWKRRFVAPLLVILILLFGLRYRKVVDTVFRPPFHLTGWIVMPKTIRGVSFPYCGINYRDLPIHIWRARQERKLRVRSSPGLSRGRNWPIPPKMGRGAICAIVSIAVRKVIYAELEFFDVIFFFWICDDRRLSFPGESGVGPNRQADCSEGRKSLFLDVLRSFDISHALDFWCFDVDFSRLSMPPTSFWRHVQLVPGAFCRAPFGCIFDVEFRY